MNLLMTEKSLTYNYLIKVGQKQKTEKKKKKKKRRRKKREKERKLVITMAKLRMAHASTHGARKPPGPISQLLFH